MLVLLFGVVLLTVWRMTKSLLIAASCLCSSFSSGEEVVAESDWVSHFQWQGPHGVDREGRGT